MKRDKQRAVVSDLSDHIIELQVDGMFVCLPVYTGNEPLSSSQHICSGLLAS